MNTRLLDKLLIYLEMHGISGTVITHVDQNKDELAKYKCPSAKFWFETALTKITELRDRMLSRSA